LGSEHPDTATSYHNLGVLYKNMGKNQAAEEYYLKALRIREKVK
jgi:Tfp pilus assembly protein PilF